MKKLILLFTLIFQFSILITHSVRAQAPQKFNYQAVARDAKGNILSDSHIDLRISLTSASDMDRPVYVEEHSVTTNKLGLFNLQIGGGETIEGNIQDIDWGGASHYLSLEVDAEGFGNFQQMGTSQLLSVPYALYAEKSGMAAGAGDVRSDPNDWTINGNSGTDASVNFIGTLDAQDIVFRANDTEVARFTTDSALQMTSGGQILFGTTNALNMDGDRNIHIGERAGEVSSGDQNAFIGYNAGFTNTTGSKNTFVGPTAGRANTTGDQNAFIGGRAGFNNTSGAQNAFIGWQAGRDNTSGKENTFIGKYAGLTNVDGTQNTYIGAGADGSTGLTNATAIGANASVTQDSSLVLGNSANVGIGTSAPDAKLHVVGAMKLVDGTQADGYVLTSDADGNASWSNASILEDADNDTKIQVEKSTDEDIIRIDLAGTEYFQIHEGRIHSINAGGSVFLGQSAGINDDLSDNRNTGVGYVAANSTTTGSDNAAFGSYSLQHNTTGSNNVAVGKSASSSNTTASDNVAIGRFALYDNQTGSYNVAVGSEALEYGGTADANNTAIGRQAGYNTDATGGVYIGYQAGKGHNGDNKLFIDNSSTGSPLIYGEFDNDLVRINGELDVEGNLTTNYNWITNNGNDQGIYIGDNGYVGINTSTYSAPLNVNGDAEVGGGSSDHDGNSEYFAIHGQSDDWFLAVQNESSSSASDFFIGQSYTEDGIFHIQQDGNVGIGTSSPSALLHVDGTLKIGGVFNTQSNWISGDGDSEGLYVDASGDVGVGTDSPSDAMHALGTSVRYRAEATNGSYAGFVAENTNGEFFLGVQGTGDPNSGEFHIYDNTAGAQRMVITSAGNVGLGYWGPGYRLRVNGQVAGNGAYVNASDRKYKTNIAPIGSALDKISQLQGVSYDWKTKEFPDMVFDNRHQLGFIAQDVEAIVPEAVSIAEGGDYGLSYSTFIPLLVEAVKELKAENEALKAELHTEKTANAQRLQRLEQQLGMGLKAQR